MPPAKRTSVFTHIELRALKCQTGKPFTDITEGGGRDAGFGIRVYASQKKVFFFKFRLDGKLRYMSLGEFDSRYTQDPKELKASLEKAHNAYKAARKLVQQGSDPRVGEPDATIGSLTEVKENDPFLEKPAVTMSVIFDNFIQLSKRRDRHSPQAVKNHEYVFNSDGRLWMERVATSISQAEVIQHLNSIVERGVPGQARNLLKSCRAAWEYARSAQLVNASNPFRDINLRHVLPELLPKKRDRVLSKEELRSVWQGLESPPGSDSVRRALQMILLTAQRPGEVAAMHRSEIQGNWWTIPTERTKYKVGPYRVYLSNYALELIGDEAGYIFPSPTDRDAPIATGSISGFVRKVRIHDKWPKSCCYGIEDWHPHDLRRTVRTALPELGIIDEYAEEILNHTKAGITATYNIYKYDKEKEDAMRRWEKQIRAITSESPEVATTPSKRLLSDDEIRIVWQRLNGHTAGETTCRLLKMMLVTGQLLSHCAAMRRSDISASHDGTWWRLEGRKIFLTKTALSIADGGTDYIFPSRDSHLQIGTVSYYILRMGSFGLEKWTPQDLTATVAAKIGELGASAKIVESIKRGGHVNEWELRFWLERWEEAILKLVK